MDATWTDHCRYTDVGHHATETMDGRWLLLGFGLLFGTLTVAFVLQEKALQAVVAAVHAVATLGGFWWYATRDERVETNLSLLS